MRGDYFAVQELFRFCYCSSAHFSDNGIYFTAFFASHVAASEFIDGLPYIIGNHQYSDYTGEADISIFYPELSIVSKEHDLDVEKINELLSSSAKEILNRNRDRDSSIYGSYYITFASSKLLSVLYTQSTYVQGMAFPIDECSAVTIDMTNNHVLCLADYVDSSVSIQSIIMDNRYEVEYGCFTTLSNSSVWNSIVSNYGIDHLENHLNDFFVSNDRTIHLIVGGFSHAAGDYSILSFQAD